MATDLLEQHPERLARVVAALLEVLARGEVASQRRLRDAVRTLLGRCSDGDVDAAIELLGEGVRRTTIARGATRYVLDVHALPPELRAIVRPTSTPR
jgi:hypothetical protein